jgi:hypothetical protein
MKNIGNQIAKYFKQLDNEKALKEGAFHVPLL